MQTTGNLGLKKPDGTDIVDIADLNGNMDVLDTAVKNVQDHAVDTVKHITAAERTAWNAKASTAAATTTAAGLMAAADKAKLDGVAAGANKYVHPNHTGDVTSTGDGVTAIAPGVIVNADINAAAAIDASKIGTGTVSNAEFGYLDGVTAGIQGQLNGKAPLATTPQQTTADITYYVRTDGNDGNNGLANTAGGAFRTIGKAVSMIPQIIDHAVIINITAGTYNESVTLDGFITKAAGLSIIATGVVNVTSVVVKTCYGNIAITGLTATTTTTDAFTASVSGRVLFNSCKATVSSTYAAFFAGSSNVFFENCTASNHAIGISVLAESMVYAGNNTGTGNAVAYLSGYASYFGYQGTVPAGGMVAQDSGMLVQGSGVINPWGDNTKMLRSAVGAGASGSFQSVEPNVHKKIIFGSEYYDYLDEYDPTLGRFTPKQAGIYAISAVVTTIGVSDGFDCQIFVYKGGGRDQCIGRESVGKFTDCTISGSIVTDLSAGQTLEIYFLHTQSSATSVTSDGSYTHLRIVRVA